MEHLVVNTRRHLYIGVCVPSSVDFVYCFLEDAGGGALFFENSEVEGFKDWGTPLIRCCFQLEEQQPYLFFYSLWKLCGESAFSYNASLPSEYISQRLQDIRNGECLFDGFVIGIAVNGLSVIWMYGEKKSIIISCGIGESTQELFDFYESSNLSNQLTKVRLKHHSAEVISLKNMQQYCYRYHLLFEKWDDVEKLWLQYDEKEDVPVLFYIEEMLFDGTHDKLHDGGLLNYHQAGKPKKLAVTWHVNKSEYTAYFWFEDEAIRNVFDRFYGVHPDTKTDFMIRIDAEKNKYELALYRYGLKEPVIISPSAYQLLVFKNKFECYRSENYNQPRGAWIW